MKFNVLTLFPDMFSGFTGASIISRAIKAEIIDVNLINFREYSNNKHNNIDDYPYGGGSGMLMTVAPLATALKENNLIGKKVIYLTPKGKVFDQKDAIDLSKEEEITFVCGHYEGVDQRFIDRYVTDEYSIGDYVLTGGELPVMVMIDSISRMIEGVLSSNVSFEEESHYRGLLEHPHYTRPSVYDGDEVPSVLISGNHKLIEEWRFFKSLEITKENRPDMYKKYIKNETDKKLLKLIKKFEENDY